MKVVVQVAGATLEVADRFADGTKVKAHKAQGAQPHVMRAGATVLPPGGAVAAAKVKDGVIKFTGLDEGAYFAHGESVDGGTATVRFRAK